MPVLSHNVSGCVKRDVNGNTVSAPCPDVAGGLPSAVSGSACVNKDGTSCDDFPFPLPVCKRSRCADIDFSFLNTGSVAPVPAPTPTPGPTPAPTPTPGPGPTPIPCGGGSEDFLTGVVTEWKGTMVNGTCVKDTTTEQVQQPEGLCIGGAGPATYYGVTNAVGCNPTSLCEEIGTKNVTASGNDYREGIDRGVRYEAAFIFKGEKVGEKCEMLPRPEPCSIFKTDLITGVKTIYKGTELNGRCEMIHQLMYNPKLETAVVADPDPNEPCILSGMAEIDGETLGALLEEFGLPRIPSLDGMICDYQKQRALYEITRGLEFVANGTDFINDVASEYVEVPAAVKDVTNYVDIVIPNPLADCAQIALAAIRFGQLDFDDAIFNLLRSVPGFGEILYEVLGYFGLTTMITEALDGLSDDRKRKIVKKTLKPMKKLAAIPVPNAASILASLLVCLCYFGLREWDEAVFALLSCLKILKLTGRIAKVVKPAFDIVVTVLKGYFKVASFVDGTRI